MIGLDSYSRQVFNYLDLILIYISLWIDCLFEIRKIAACFIWISLPGHYRVTDEALLAETTLYDPSSFLLMFSLLLKELVFYFISKSGSMLSQSEGQILIDIMNDHGLEHWT